MKNIAVFCGSSAGISEVYAEQAELVGKTLADKGIGVVYGGARIGLMGAVADGALQNGGKVTGVLPNFLRSKEIAHAGLTELITVESMHQRKMKMHELSDGIITLPGGFGTMEELFEMITWAQLGLHKYPIGLLNTQGFYNPLIELLQAMTDQGFLKEKNRVMLLVADTVEELLEKMQNYHPPIIGKWITKEET